MSGCDGLRDTKPRVAWHTIILPRDERGLGIIDPEMQSAALLSKLIVRGLFPGDEPWKQFLHFALSRCVPLSGWMDVEGPWVPSGRYISTSEVRLRTDHLSPFMKSIIKIWFTMRRGLIKKRCLDEFERQPLTWNEYA